MNAPANSEIPTLERLVNEYPDAGFDKNNYNARMLRPMLNIDFEMPDRPGTLINYAEVEFLLAEAKSKGWNVNGTTEEHFQAGVRAAMQWLNNHYLDDALKIADDEVDAYIHHIMATNPLATEAGAREAINTQAWILHMMNPSEAWANLRRSDFPVILDRTKLPTWNWAVDDRNHLETPTRLRYPSLEGRYNKANYEEAVKRLGTVNDKGENVDDWHHRLWWDTADIHVK
ncbi:MAG: SusD/RagB family nutrient-binding outer membrane lipoprotein [Prevotella sp.]|nr:SusD/RagB family nutrient-binding outer membrane lipoprotein [Prevotella sp.]